MKRRLRSEQLDWRQIDEEIVILDGLRAEYLTLNCSGAVLWRRLAEGATPEELSSALLAAYDDLDPASAATDTDAFLSELACLGLLEG